jgi:UDP-N-acetylmuramyl pentapeptide synthase
MGAPTRFCPKRNEISAALLYNDQINSMYTSTETLYDIFRKGAKVSTDTRQITGGCIFFALKGDKFDGNQYAAEALQKGAAYAVVDDPAVVTMTVFFWLKTC